MAKAGFCASCQRNVWLATDGGCENGHPASDVSGVYEASTPSAPPAGQTVGRSGRRLLVVGSLTVVVLIIAACAVLAITLPPLLNKGAAKTREWQGRLASDYPGWRQMSFNANSGGGETHWAFGLVPPGRKFVVGVAYLERDGARPVVQDEVLRPAGKYHDRAESLLDFLESTYIRQGKNIASVTSDSSGTVKVNWLKVSQIGPVSSRIGSLDELTYDEQTRSWRSSPGPGQ